MPLFNVPGAIRFGSELDFVAPAYLNSAYTAFSSA